MTPGRERGAALGSLVLGAALMLFAGGRVWYSGRAAVDGLPAVPLRLTGRDVAALVSAVGLLALAGAALLLLVGGVVRRIAGGVLLVGGVAAAVRVVYVIGYDRGTIVEKALQDAASGTATDSVTTVVYSPWPWVALLGSVLVALGGAVLLFRAGHWPERSKRYETTAANPDLTDQPTDASSDAMWKALDRGEDPTD